LFGRIWLSSLVNLAFACLLTIISYLDVLIHPVGEWQVGQPAPASYRAPASRDSVTDELQSVLGKESIGDERFIIRKDEVVSEASRLELMRLLPERARLDFHRTGGVFVFYFLALTFFNLLLRRYGRYLLIRFRAVVALYLALGLGVLASRFLLTHTEVSLYALPAAFVTILFTPLLGQNIGFVVHLLSLALIAPMISTTPGMVLIPLVTGWTAVLLLNRESGPVRMFIAAGAGALMGGLFLLGLDLFSPQPIDYRLDAEGDLAGLVGGILACGLAASLFSYPSTVLFGAVPRSRLRALLDMDHPLLKDLAEKAPGTFQHSLAMANMAEKVADDLGADAELVRVGAYYHDIGKMHEPQYFIENQQGENPHEQMSPGASAEKLRNHVLHGVTIAKGADLPERVVDFVVEHHGLSTMEYFLDKAYRANGKVLDLEMFHYQGRNPTSRETAILMIVDSVEAASRTLREPNQGDIENLVRRIVFSKMLHGYLDESGLTTRDLKQVGIGLIKFLQGQFHVRVEYPWQKKVSERPPLQVIPDTHAGIATAQNAPDSASRVAAPVVQAVQSSPPKAAATEEPSSESPRPAPLPGNGTTGEEGQGP
jgi:putative nucleotidyltransferase with HDIG domain